MLIPCPHPCLQLAKDERLLYRGEGNSSLVIALRAERKVIRLLKEDAKQLKNIDKEDICSMLLSHIAFVENIVREVISDHFFAAPELIRLSESQIETIRRLVGDKRPSFRLDKSIGSGATFALLLPDYCCLPKGLRLWPTIGPVIAVEIKPKQGFLPDASLLSDELRIKSLVCRYSLSQFHKLKKGSVATRSHYCPLDLFSGCPSRMQTALSALIDAPQNNFRVFRDVQLCYGEDSNTPLSPVIEDFVGGSEAGEEDTRDAFCRLLVRALTLRVSHVVEDDLMTPNPSPPLQRQLCALHDHRCRCDDVDACDHVLPKGSVLEAVLRAQRLDSVDSLRANEILDALENNNNEEDVLLGAMSAKDLSSEETNERKRKLWQFVVSLTAKDCSVMVAMQALDERNGSLVVPERHLVVDPNSGRRYVTSVCVTDLDPKPCHKIRRTLSNDRRMIRAYYQHF